MVHMLDLHKENTRTSTQEQSRRLEEPPPVTLGPPDKGSGRAPLKGGVAAHGWEAIIFRLADPTSTAFEE